MSENLTSASEETLLLPMLPLRDVVVYPHTVIPLFVGREKSIHALEAAMVSKQQVFLVAQRNAKEEEPAQRDLYDVGTVATILQLLKLPDGTLKVLIEGEQRAELLSLTEEEGGWIAEIQLLEEEGFQTSQELEVMGRSLLSLFEQYVKLNKKIPPEVTASLSEVNDLSRLTDSIAAHLSLKASERQELLELTAAHQRVERLIAFLEFEIDLLQIEKRVRGRVKRQMEKSQREYYLNEQIKAIQKELGEIEDGVSELEELEQRIEDAKMPKDARERVDSELKKLKNMAPMSAEATVCRNYIDTMVSVPWVEKSRVRHDVVKAQDILDQDHYGLEEIKERILEYLAVQKRVKKLKGPILCLVGPPGVGKTSLGQSIAKATNRAFVRMALGGVRDEAEIRGHRRTYIGSMPGKIIQKLSKIKKRNPLFLLDEIDKMAMDFRGDPASALLEVLDPEQNQAFNDHYLEVDYDLSDVMFVATSNSLDIPAPLLDRMEVIRIPGYTEDEKLNIAKRYLLPKQMKNSGLKQKECVVDDETVLEIIRYYTREAGVRSLERELSKLCRKLVKEILQSQGDITKIHVSPEKLEAYLGVKRHRFGVAEEEDRIGLVTGLAWTQVGGELLTVEAVAMPGEGKVSSTGQLGDVMKESIQAAVTVVRARAEAMDISDQLFKEKDLHIHVPEGATPKDGPSAGIAMCTALVSTLTSIPVRADVAMTGEITLRGEVLPIGGLKEKLLAAHRGGIQTVLIPEENRRELKEVPENILEALTIKPVRWIDEVLSIALSKNPFSEALPSTKGRQVSSSKKKGGNKPIQTH